MRDLPVCSINSSTIKKALEEGKRLDGRKMVEHREIKFIFPPATSSKLGCKGGTCIVSLGLTKVMAKISLSITQPQQRKPSQGIFIVQLDKSPLTSFGSIGQQESHQTRLQELLKLCISDCIDLDSLCVVAGESVFKLYLEIRILSNYGNVLDCAAMASLIALSTFRRPDVSLSSNRQVVVHTDWSQREPVPLTFRRFPFIVTVGFIENTSKNGVEHYIHDPNFIEENVLSGRLVVGMNIHKELCCLHMLGNSPIATEKIVKAVNLVDKKVVGLNQIFRVALQAYDNHHANPRLPQCKVPVVFSSLQLIDYDKTSHLQTVASSAAVQNKKMFDEEEENSEISEGEVSSPSPSGPRTVYDVAVVATKDSEVWQPSSSGYQLLSSHAATDEPTEYDPANVVPFANFADNDDSEEEGEILEY